MLQNVQFELSVHARLLVFVYFSKVFHGKAEFSNVRTNGCDLKLLLFELIVCLLLFVFLVPRDYIIIPLIFEN